MWFLPAFGAKARARDMALAELRPLLAMERLPANFWDQPYAVGFIMGYVDAAANLVAGDKTSVDLVTDVTTRVVDALAPGEIEMIAKRLVRWSKPLEPQFAEGRRNGNFFAMFMHGDRKADATELAIEAFKQARARAPVFDQMKHQTNERGRAAMILCDVLFFDKIFKRGADPVSGDIAVQERSRYGEIDTAVEYTARHRQAIEQTSRASVAEIQMKAAQFSPKELLGPASAYNTMRRDDFCDVILTALREGSLSEEDATLAVYMREWVLSGGDLRTPFPEWLASGEALDRLGVLQNEWIRAAFKDAAIKRMSFNQWLAATDSRRPPNL